jgi:hypothetical protein
VGVPDEARLQFVEQAAYRWLWQTEVVQEAFGSHSGPKLLLKYEDLRRDPFNELTRLARWLGLPSDAETVSPIVEKHLFENIPPDERGPKSFFRSAAPGLWETNLSADEQEVMLGVLEPKLGELGYVTEVPEESGRRSAPVTPSPPASDRSGSAS